MNFFDWDEDYFDYYSLCVLDTSKPIVSFYAWIRIKMGEHITDLEVYVLLGFVKGLKTLKHPLTYLSYGIVCLSIPWNRSWTVKIWFKIGDSGGINIYAIYRLLLSQCSESKTSVGSLTILFSMNRVSVEKQYKLIAKNTILSITSLFVILNLIESKKRIGNALSCT